MSEIAEFMLEFNVKEARIDSIDQTLCASLSEEEIAGACIDYSADSSEPFIPT